MSRSRTHSPFPAVAAVIAIALTACGSASVASKHPATARPSTPTPTPVRTPSAAPAPPPLAAPLLVQIENSSDARPQAGLSVADVVYEYETEGGISRFSAMYFQPPGPQVLIGPVRSARIVTITLTSIYDATLLYSGASAFVYNTLATSTLRQYNEGASQGALFRVNSRVAPHNLYTDGAHIAALEQRIGAHTVKYQLWSRTPQQGLPPGGTLATRFSVPVSQSETPAFTYDTATGGYTRTEPDTGILNEADAGLPWQPRNVVVLQVPVAPRADDVEDVSGALGLEFGLQGSGDGQLAVGGQLYPIKWAQSGSAPPQLTLASGAPAPIAPGQVLFELVGTGKTVSVG